MLINAGHNFINERGVAYLTKANLKNVTNISLSIYLIIR